MQAIVKVDPYNVLEIVSRLCCMYISMENNTKRSVLSVIFFVFMDKVVGSGGGAGVSGTSISVVEKEEMLRRVKAK